MARFVVAAAVLASSAAFQPARPHLAPPMQQRSVTNRQRSLCRLRAGAAAPAAGSVVFRAAVGAVGQLVVTTAVGALTVKKGVVTPDQITALARVIYNLFLPCFLFCSVVKTVTTYGLEPTLLLMPVFAAAQIVVAHVASRLVASVAVDPTDEDGAKQLLLSGTFNNPGVLPLLFFDALFRNHADPALYPRLVASTSFYLMGFTPLYWSLGNRILDGGDAADAKPSSLAEAVARVARPPPVLASLVALGVAATPLATLLVGDGAPLATVFRALERFAGAYLPSASLVLAGSLISGGPAAEDADAGFPRRVALICLLKYAVIPALGFASLAGLEAAGLFPSAKARPLLWFFLLTQFAMPPAQNTVVMYQLRDAPRLAAKQAKALLVIYAAAAVPLSFLFQLYLTYCGL